MKPNLPNLDEVIMRRDLFAAFAMHAFLTMRENENVDLEKIAEYAYEWADKMEWERHKYESVAQSVDPTPEPTAKSKKTKAAKTEQPIAEVAPVIAAPAPAPAPKPAEESFTVQDLRAEAQKALETGKATEIVALNKEYGVKRISEVTPDLYPVIIKKLRAINGQT